MTDDHGREEYWDNTVGIGFDATVTIRSRRFKKAHGFLIYLLAVLQTIILNHEAPMMQITTDRESWQDETMLLVACNGGREGGGFNVAPEAVLDDAVLNYATIRHVSRPMMFRLLPEVMKGTHGRFRQVRMGQFLKMDVVSEQPMCIHTDGEIFAGFGIDLRRIMLEILPSALDVVK
jgi:diacylglycerol kinase family enzyme